MIIENDYDGHRFLVQFLRPYLQCWRCEKPFGCLQLMLRLYLSDHLWRRVRVRVCLVGIDVLVCVCMYVCIYIYKKKKSCWLECWCFYSYTWDSVPVNTLYRGLCPPLTPWPTALRFTRGHHGIELLVAA